MVKKQLLLKSILFSSWRYIISSVVMGACIWFLKIGLMMNIQALVLEICIGGLIYFACLFLLKEDFIIPNLKSTIRKLDTKHNK